MQFSFPLDHTNPSKLASSVALVLRNKVARQETQNIDFAICKALVADLNQLICRSWCCPSSWRCVLSGQNWQRRFESKQINWQRVKTLHDVFQSLYQKANRYMQQGNKYSSLSYLLRNRFPMLNFVWCLATCWQADEIPNAAFPNMLPGNFGTHDDWQSQGTTCLCVRDANQLILQS